MLSLIVVALVTVAAGFVVWANDKRHAKYGIAVPAGVSLAAGMVSWIIFIAAGLGYQPGLTWIPWVLPMVLGAAAAVAAALYLGKTRTGARHCPAHHHPALLAGSPRAAVPASVTTTRSGAWSRLVKAPPPPFPPARDRSPDLRRRRFRGGTDPGGCRAGGRCGSDVPPRAPCPRRRGSCSEGTPCL